MRKKHELVNDVVKALSLQQDEIAEQLGYAGPSTISKALAGKNDRALQRVIELLFEEYGYDEAHFYPTLAKEFKVIEQRVEALEKEIRSLKDLILQRLLR
mgnify:CR=1 FL=1